MKHTDKLFIVKEAFVDVQPPWWVAPAAIGTIATGLGLASGAGGAVAGGIKGSITKPEDDDSKLNHISKNIKDTGKRNLGLGLGLGYGGALGYGAYAAADKTIISRLYKYLLGNKDQEYISSTLPNDPNTWIREKNPDYDPDAKDILDKKFINFYRVAAPITVGLGGIGGAYLAHRLLTRNKHKDTKPENEQVSKSKPEATE